jgi:hypothetical protein
MFPSCTTLQLGTHECRSVNEDTNERDARSREAPFSVIVSMIRRDLQADALIDTDHGYRGSPV